MEAVTYIINEGHTSQYYGLKTADTNEILHCAPNNWKTKQGAIRWAAKHSFNIAAE